MKIRDLNLLSVNFEINNKFMHKQKEDSFIPEIAIDNIIVKKKKELLLLLGVRKIKGNVPYYFEVRAGASFIFDKLPSKKILEQFAKINCPAIIFPYIRETIADLTRRAGFPPLHLDPINFIEMGKRVDKAKKDNKQKVASK
jgi:preprotein translocase subunit SecB